MTCPPFLALTRCALFACALLATTLGAAGCGRHKAASRDAGREAAPADGGGDATTTEARDATDARDATVDVSDATDAVEASDADSACRRGNTELASASAAGVPGNKESRLSRRKTSMISDDGRYVAFVSDATNLVAGASFPGVYLRDTCRGAGAACVPATTLVSVTMDGKPPDGYEPFFGNAAISGSGRYVAFDSTVANLVAGGNVGSQVYVRDTCLGAAGPCTPSMTRVSVTSTGAPLPTPAEDPMLSGDGRYVLFGDNGGLFLRDTCSGATSCTPRTIDVSTLPGGTSAGSFSSTLSRDGRFIFHTAENPAGGNGNQIFARLIDTCIGAGAGCTPSTTWVNPGLNGEAGNSEVNSGMVTRGGRYVVFTSFASNMVAGDTNQLLDVFVRDTCIGAGTPCTPKTLRASLGNDGSEVNSHARDGVATDDGRYIFFESDATTLAQNDSHPKIDVFVRDTCAGAAGACTPTTKFVVWARCGAHPDDDVHLGWPSPDGRVLVVRSAAKNLEGPAGLDGANIFVVPTGL